MLDFYVDKGDVQKRNIKISFLFYKNIVYTLDYFKYS